MSIDKDHKVTQRYNVILAYVLIFFMIILGIAVVMSIKNSLNQREILVNSVKAQLISTSLAAREMLDIEAFVGYADASVAKDAHYQATLQKLRDLSNSVGAKYIYALKRQGTEYVFVFDTDTEDNTVFIPYTLSAVHEAAFAGRDAADVMNVDDEYGSFNTGAVPILHNGEIVGIISTDIDDKYLEESSDAAMYNSAVLICILLVTMSAMFCATRQLLIHIRQMQERLERQALYDTVTGLPNRQYLMDYLTKITTGREKAAFALFFIDLDNFKKVNDNAGHDAGDDLLKQIAAYLDSALTNAKAFRPSAGKLNIAARVGGDEFIQVVNGVSNAGEAAKVAESLLGGFKSANISRYVEKYNIGLSIGVALYPHDTENYHVLIKYADMAMYHAKNDGKNQYRIYSDEMGGEK